MVDIQEEGLRRLAEQRGKVAESSREVDKSGNLRELPLVNGSQVEEVVHLA